MSLVRVGSVAWAWWLPGLASGFWSQTAWLQAPASSFVTQSCFSTSSAGGSGEGVKGHGGALHRS